MSIDSCPCKTQELSLFSLQQILQAIWQDIAASFLHFWYARIYSKYEKAVFDKWLRTVKSKNCIKEQHRAAALSLPRLSHYTVNVEAVTDLVGVSTLLIEGHHHLHESYFWRAGLFWSTGIFMASLDGCFQELLLTEGTLTASSPQTQYAHLYTYLHTDRVRLEKTLQINTQEWSNVLLFAEITPLTYLDANATFAVVTWPAASWRPALGWAWLSSIPLQQPRAIAKRSYLLSFLGLHPGLSSSLELRRSPLSLPTSPGPCPAAGLHTHGGRARQGPAGPHGRSPPRQSRRARAGRPGPGTRCSCSWARDTWLLPPSSPSEGERPASASDIDRPPPRRGFTNPAAFLPLRWILLPLLPPDIPIPGCRRRWALPPAQLPPPHPAPGRAEARPQRAGRAPRGRRRPARGGHCRGRIPGVRACRAGRRASSAGPGEVRSGVSARDRGRGSAAGSGGAPRAACSSVTATGARRLRCQQPSASPPARRARKGPVQRVGTLCREVEGAAAAPRLASPLPHSPLCPQRRLAAGPSLSRPPLRRRPGACGRRCHGAAHAGVQRLLLGQSGFQGAPEVSRDRAGEDEQVHQGAD